MSHPIVQTMLESIMILLFEALGTALLTCLYLATEGGAGMFIGFFILLIFSARISGSHYNPIVTLAFMLRKDAGQFNKWLGILYMLFQLGGAYVGCLVSFYFFGTRDYYLTVTTHPLQCMFSEVLGAFILVTMYLT